MPVIPGFIRLALCMLCLFAFAETIKADPPLPDEAWTFTFRFENDLFADTDRNYTNGLKFSWISPDLERFRDSGVLPAWAKNWISKLPFSGKEGLQRNITFSVGQLIYTPTDIERRDLIVDDRPYAGWLYSAFSFHNKSYRHLDTIEFQFGVLGPLSQAEAAQDLIHDLRNIPKANGWDNQLKNEPGLVLVYENKSRVVPLKTFEGWGFDAITHYGGAAGNVYTYLNTGLEMRFGWNVPTDFGTSLIRPGGETNAPTDSNDPRYTKVGHGFSLHAFAATSARLVLRDIFLDGNTFRDSHSVDKEWLVADFVLGLSMIIDRFKFSYAQVVRTKEFKGQDSGHNFGSISLSITY